MKPITPLILPILLATTRCFSAWSLVLIGNLRDETTKQRFEKAACTSTTKNAATS